MDRPLKQLINKMTEILIVDDELGIRNILSEILVESGYRVATAANANEARAKVAERQYDLVLLDIWMPYGRSRTSARMEVRRSLKLPRNHHVRARFD